MVVKSKDPRAQRSSISNKSHQIKKRQKRPAATNGHSVASAFAAAAPPPDGSDERETRACLIAQEIKFAKLFAGNDTKLSEKQLRRLRHWLTIRSNSSFPFDHSNFMRIWKGLFYSMWMSDKPLPQEQLAERISQLVHAFDKPDVAVQFFGAHLATMAAEWFGIDQWRIDKFMMLVRRCARQMLQLVHAAGWPAELLQQLNAQLTQTVLRSSTSIGFFMHFTELWLEEVAKVTQGQLPVEAVTALVQPFGAYLARPRDAKLCRHVVKHVFNWLLFQSELGREYQEKFEAWKSVGFAGNTIEAMERAEEEDSEGEGEDGENGEEVEDEEEDVEAEEVDEEENEEDEEEEEEDDGTVHLDPRAGRVDVVMHEIQFDPQQIIEQLETEKTKAYTNVKSRQQIARVINNYESFATGRFPLGIQQIRLKSDADIALPRLDDKVNEIVQFERKLRAADAPLQGHNKRNRKRLLAGQPVAPAALAAAAERRKRHQLDQQLDFAAELKQKQRQLKRQKLAAEQNGGADHEHEHDGNGCCGEQLPRKRRSITPAEKAKVRQWTEEDLPVVQVTEATPKKSEKIADSPPKPAKQAKSRKSVTLAAKPVADPWLEPLQEGEVEFSSPSRKRKLQQIAAAESKASAASAASPPAAVEVAAIPEVAATPEPVPAAASASKNRVINPAALLLSRIAAGGAASPKTPTSSASKRKSVSIVLKNNRSQERRTYDDLLRTLGDSPATPHDPAKVPVKSALKPNLMPSPINPYYRKKIGLSFD